MGIFSKGGAKAPPPPQLNTNYQGAPDFSGLRVPQAPGAGEMPRYPGAPGLEQFRNAPGPMAQTGRWGMPDPNMVGGAGQDYMRRVAGGGAASTLPGSNPQQLIEAQKGANREQFRANAMGRKGLYGATEFEYDAQGNPIGQKQTLTGPAGEMLESAGQAGQRTFAALPGQSLEFDNSTLQQFADSGFATQMALLQPQFDQQRNRAEEELTNRGIPVGSEVWNAEIGNLEKQQALAKQQAGRDAMMFAPQNQALTTNTQITQHMQPYGEAQAAFGLFSGLGNLAPGYNANPTLGMTDVAGIALGAGNQQLAGANQALGANSQDFTQNQQRFANQMGLNSTDFAQRQALWGQDLTGAQMANQNLVQQFGMGQTAAGNQLGALQALFGMQNTAYGNQRQNLIDPWAMNMQAQNAGNQAMQGQYGMQMQQYEANQRAQQAAQQQWGQLLGLGASIALMPMTGGLSGGFTNTLLGGAMGGMGLFGGGMGRA